MALRTLLVSQMWATTVTRAAKIYDPAAVVTGDLPTVRGRADGDAGRHDVRSMHVCAGLPSAGFLAVAPIPLVVGASCRALRLIMGVAN